MFSEQSGITNDPRISSGSVEAANSGNDLLKHSLNIMAQGLKLRDFEDWR